MDTSSTTSSLGNTYRAPSDPGTGPNGDNIPGRVPQNFGTAHHFYVQDPDPPTAPTAPVDLVGVWYTDYTAF